jgi:hypothetical protein
MEGSTWKDSVAELKQKFLPTYLVGSNDRQADSS